jgi:hypothetical protein
MDLAVSVPMALSLHTLLYVRLDSGKFMTMPSCAFVVVEIGDIGFAELVADSLLVASAFCSVLGSLFAEEIPAFASAETTTQARMDA